MTIITQAPILSGTAEELFDRICHADNPAHDLVDQYVSAIVERRDPRIAFFTILRFCVAVERSLWFDKLLRVILEMRDPEWAQAILHSDQLVNARDPDDPMGLATLSLNLTEQERGDLIDMIALSHDPRWIYETLRLVFLRTPEKRLLVRYLKKTENREWIQDARENLHLPEELLELVD